MVKQMLLGQIDSSIVVGEEELEELVVRREQQKVDMEAKAIEDEKIRLKEEQDALKKKKAKPKKKEVDVEGEDKKEVDEEDKKEEEEVKKVRRQPVSIEHTYYFQNYLKAILNNKLILPAQGVRFFSHVVELREDSQ